MEFRPFIGVAALALVFIFVASMIHKYRLWQAEKMAKAQRFLRGAKHIEGALESIGAIALPRSVTRLFKEERVLRYQEALRLMPQYEDASERLRQLESSHEGEGADPGWDAPDFNDAQQASGYAAGLSELVAYLTLERSLSELSVADAKTLREQLRTLRAESKAKFHHKVAEAAAEQGDWEKAQQEFMLLITYLKSKAPSNERGKVLYQEALDAYQDVFHKRLPGKKMDDAATT
jgi:hypothetical protein